MVDVKDLQAGVGVLPLFAVDKAADAHFGRIGVEFVCGNDAGAHGRKAVQTFAEIPLLVGGLHIAGGNVVQDGVAEHRVPGLPGRHILGIFAQHHSQLALIVQLLHKVGVGFDKAAVRHGAADPFGKVDGILVLRGKGVGRILLGFVRVRHIVDAFSTQHQDAIYFSKRVSRAVPDGGFIEAHTDLVQKLDYECELAVVLGKDAKDVPAGQTKDYVFGYTILNDVSARDVQTAHKQWYFGKSLDGFTPMGPCIVTADEFDTYPPALPIRSRVNGELRQDSNTKLQIFDIDHVIHELSQGMTLKAGTIIATGTPAGVGMGMDPPQFLHPGDTVQCEIEGIGTLTNTVR